jgi:hypothetical protein
MKRRSGAILLETALFLPIILALLIGTAALARVIYTYEMIEKVMFDLARYLGTQQGASFCTAGDPVVQGAINNALTGTVDGTGNPIIAGLTPDMVQVGIERFDPNAQQVVACACSTAGCDASQGGLPPSFIVVSLANGYPMQPAFWGFGVVQFSLYPAVRVPYGGT